MVFGMGIEHDIYAGLVTIFGDFAANASVIIGPGVTDVTRVVIGNQASLYRPSYGVLATVRGNVRQLVTDSQVLWFLSIAFMAVATLTVWQWLGNDVAFLEALRYVSFNSVSLMTGTGYSTVTLLARFRGLSTSLPRSTAAW